MKPILTLKGLLLVIVASLLTILLYLLLPSPLSIVPSSVVFTAFLIISKINQPKLSITSYVSKDTMSLGENVLVNIIVKSEAPGKIKIYDIPPPTTIVINGAPFFESSISREKTLEVSYMVKPLTLGDHRWQNLVVVFEEENGIFKFIYEYDAPRTVKVIKPKISCAKRRFAGVSEILFEGFSPTFSHIRPYVFGDSLKHIVYKSILSPSGVLSKVFSKEKIEFEVFRKPFKIITYIAYEVSEKSLSIMKYFLYRLFMELSKIGRKVVINEVVIEDVEDIDKALKRRVAKIENYDLLITTFKGSKRLRRENIVIIPEYSNYYELFKQLKLSEKHFAKKPSNLNYISIENFEESVENILRKILLR